MSIEATPSKLAQSILMLDGDPFTLEDRNYILPVYDGGYERVLLYTGRQVEKSTTLAAKLVSDMILTPYTTGLYVAPTQEQARVFSSQKIDPFIRYSPFVRKNFTSTKKTDRVLQRQLTNGSELYLRYMYLTADRIRGLSADTLCIDEIQDMLRDEIPVVEEVQSHSKRPFQLYAGTPKSKVNAIQHYWDLSTKNEWVIKCTSCGTYQTVEEHNLEKKGLSCRKCGSLLNPQNGVWISTTEELEEPYYQGFRIPQPIVPWIQWDKIWYKYTKAYTRQKFYNEVLARPYDMVTKPITQDELLAICEDREFDSGYEPRTYGNLPLVMGVDYATPLGEESFTIVTIGGLVGDRFRVAYSYRYEGKEADFNFIFNDILRLCRVYKVQVLGVDWGVGSGGINAQLRQALSHGGDRLTEYQLVGRLKETIKWDPDAYLFRLDRTEILKYFFLQLKHKMVLFPKWEVSGKYLKDFLSFTVEYSESRKSIMYDREPGRPDDYGFSTLFAYLTALMLAGKMDVYEPRLPVSIRTF